MNIISPTKSDLQVVIISVVLNIVLPLIMNKFASKDEIKPPTGANNLSFKGQIMHMLVHHAQVPITSSIIIALIVFLSLVINKVVMKK